MKTKSKNKLTNKNKFLTVILLIKKEKSEYDADTIIMNMKSE